MRLHAILRGRATLLGDAAHAMSIFDGVESRHAVRVSSLPPSSEGRIISIFSTPLALHKPYGEWLAKDAAAIYGRRKRPLRSGYEGRLRDKLIESPVTRLDWLRRISSHRPHITTAGMPHVVDGLIAWRSAKDAALLFSGGRTWSTAPPWRAARAAALRQGQRRWLRDEAPSRDPPPVAFAFDIDGVLKRGPLTLPQAKRALRILEGKNPRGAKVPYIFITNGGGVTEEKRARALSEDFEIAVSPKQIVQSHTVFKSLLPRFQDESVLVVGGAEDGSCREVAENYGFKRVYTPHDILAWDPNSWPFSSLSEAQLSKVRRADFAEVAFKAIFVFHDSRDWGRDVQYITDILRAKDGALGTLMRDKVIRSTEQLPVYFSNPDLVWGTNFPVPRLGQNAFRLAVENVYKALTTRELSATTFGKPGKITYDYAQALLEQLLCEIDPSLEGPLKETVEVKGQKRRKLEPRVWMIGDNPESDIAGANGRGWPSVLVHTGVYDPFSGLSPAHRPTMEAEDVEDAVKRVLLVEWGMEL